MLAAVSLGERRGVRGDHSDGLHVLVRHTVLRFAPVNLEEGHRDGRGTAYWHRDGPVAGGGAWIRRHAWRADRLHDDAGSGVDADGTRRGDRTRWRRRLSFSGSRIQFSLSFPCGLLCLFLTSLYLQQSGVQHPLLLLQLLDDFLLARSLRLRILLKRLRRRFWQSAWE